MMNELNKDFIVLQGRGLQLWCLQKAQHAQHEQVIDSISWALSGL